MRKRGRLKGNCRSVSFQMFNEVYGEIEKRAMSAGICTGTLIRLVIEKWLKTDGTLSLSG